MGDHGDRFRYLLADLLGLGEREEGFRIVGGHLGPAGKGLFCILIFARAHRQRALALVKLRKGPGGRRTAADHRVDRRLLKAVTFRLETQAKLERGRSEGHKSEIKSLMRYYCAA